HLLPAKTRSGIKMGSFQVEDHMVKDGLTDAFSQNHMGMTAENIAEKYDISRKTQDEYAYNSQKKAIAAQAQGLFEDEITPVTVKSWRGDTVVDQDEYI